MAGDTTVEHDTARSRDMKVTCAEILTPGNCSHRVISGKMWAVSSDDTDRFGVIPKAFSLHRMGLDTLPPAELDYSDDGYAILSDPAARPELESAVRAELLAARKNASGLDASFMAGCTTLCGLLGDGDPVIAQRVLTHHVHGLMIEPGSHTALTAVAYSLGLADALALVGNLPTHLERLDAFGTEYGYEARQARRYSDRGIRELAAAIATGPINRARASADIILIQDDRDYCLSLTTRHHWYVNMEPVRLSVGTTPEDKQAVELDCQPQRDGHWIVTRHEPVVLADLQRTVVVAVTWHGELWPKFVSVIAVDQRSSSVVIEVVGNRWGAVVSRGRAPDPQGFRVMGRQTYLTHIAR